jgi:integrase
VVLLRLEITKSGRRRDVPMRQRVYDELVSRPGAREGRLWPEGSTRAGFEAAVDAARLAAPFRFHDCRHHFASWFMMRGGSVPALQKSISAGRWRRPSGRRAWNQILGTRLGESGQNASEVIEFTDERRGSSVAEQLIRNQ